MIIRLCYFIIDVIESAVLACFTAQIARLLHNYRGKCRVSRIMKQSNVLPHLTQTARVPFEGTRFVIAMKLLLKLQKRWIATSACIFPMYVLTWPYECEIIYKSQYDVRWNFMWHFNPWQVFKENRKIRFQSRLTAIKGTQVYTT